MTIRTGLDYLRKHIWKVAITIIIFSFGLGIRFLNLTNPPLDYHTWRQLRSATIARAQFYELEPDIAPTVRDEAVRLGSTFNKLEPQVLESLVSRTYLILGREDLAIARVYSIFFWMIAAVAIYRLGLRMIGIEGAWVASAFFLFHPYAITASRTFMPDPLMVSLISLTLLALYRLAESPSWKKAILTGILMGAAIYVKVFAVFLLAAAFFFLVWKGWNHKSPLKDVRLWGVLGLAILIPSTYYILETGSIAGSYLQSWVIPFNNLRLDPGFYIRWLTKLNLVVGLTFIFLGILFFGQLPRIGRWMLLGLWGGFILYGLSVPALIVTHDYYNLPIFPIVALSLAPFGQVVLTQMKSLQQPWAALAVAALAVSALYPLWVARNSLVGTDYRSEILGWKKMGEELSKDATYIGLTHDYNTRIGYYGWIEVRAWPNTVDMRMIELTGGNTNLEDPYWEELFLAIAADKDYFLVTMFNELEAQPVLRSILYERYPYIDGEGYLLFDLRGTN
jgi:4-amino-4-deoxy-L-arabinose transferase-like glycosyltransferase